MDAAWIMIALLWVAARLYRHPPPQRMALLVGTKTSGYNSWFLFDDDDQVWAYKFNQSVRIRDRYLRHVEISIGAVRWEHIIDIARFTIEQQLGIDK